MEFPKHKRIKLSKRKWEQQRVRLWQSRNGLCDYCGKPVEKDRAIPHHKVLRSRGGGDSPDNVMIVHDLCHRKLHGLK